MRIKLISGSRTHLTVTFRIPIKNIYIFIITTHIPSCMLIIFINNIILNMQNNSRKYTVKEIIKEMHILGPLGFFCIKIMSQRHNLP